MNWEINEPIHIVPVYLSCEIREDGRRVTILSTHIVAIEQVLSTYSTSAGSKIILTTGQVYDVSTPYDELAEVFATPELQP